MTFADIKKFLTKIAPLAGLGARELELLETPQNILKADLEVSGKKYPAYRVQFNNARGPYKGGGNQGRGVVGAAGSADRTATTAAATRDQLQAKQSGEKHDTCPCDGALSQSRGRLRPIVSA